MGILRSLILKNIKLKIRSPFATLFELGVPLILALILVYSHSKLPEIPKINVSGVLAQIHNLGSLNAPLAVAPIDACQAWRANLGERASLVRCFESETAIKTLARFPNSVLMNNGEKLKLMFADSESPDLWHTEFLLSDQRDNNYLLHEPMNGNLDEEILRNGAEAATGLLMVTFSQSVSKFVTLVVSEKENRLKELLLIHGVTIKILYMSWFLTAALTYGLISITISIVFFFGQIDISVLRLFVLLWTFGMASVSLALAVTAPFKSSKVASIVSLVFYFVLSLVRNVTGNSFLFLPQVAFDRGVRSLVHDGFSGYFGAIVFALLCTTIVFFATFVVLDHGYSNIFSRAERIGQYFPVSPVEVGKRVEEFGDRGGEDCVSVNGLTVSYGNFLAVENLTLTIFRSEIAVLLAPNGGGKSSLLKCMCGMIENWQGEISVFGEGGLDARRKYLGFCPQEDVLWPDLTVAEHLQLFSKLREVGAIDRLLLAAGLMGKKHSKISELSGGMKRKVNTLIAFGGDFVLLDEPTTGLDPVSRRATHEMIRSLTNGRVILLTTHFMDEAEFLGERILIMIGGRLKASGSPAFLKKSFDCGHVLTFSSPLTESAVSDLLNTSEELTIKSQTKESVSLAVSAENTHSIPDLINFGRRYFRNASVDAAKLEDVFMRLAKPAFKVESLRDRRPIPQAPSAPSRRGKQLKGELRRRSIIARRDFRFLLCSLLAPLLVVASGLWLAQSISGERNFEISGQHLNIGFIGPSDAFAGNFRSIEDLSSLNLRCASDDSLCGSEIAFCHADVDMCEAWLQISRELKRSELDGIIWYRRDGVSLFPKRGERVRGEMIAGALGMRFDIDIPYESREIENMNSVARSITPAVYALMGFSFIPGGAAMGVVQERSLKAHNVVCGLSVSVYWLARFVVDEFAFLFIAFTSVFLLQSVFDPFDLAPILGAYGPASIAHSYFISSFFGEAGTAQNVVVSLTHLSGFVLVFLHRGMQFISGSRLYFHIGTILSPAFLFGDSLASLVLRNTSFSGELQESMRINVLILTVYTLLCLFGVLALEHLRGDFRSAFSKLVSRLRMRRSMRYSELEEVNTELIEASLTVSHVSRSFGKKVAVCDVSFHASIGQVYGLLGTNGAGKTTLLKISTGQLVADVGRVLVDQQEIKNNGQMIGYCPQYDVFSDELTVRENLEIMATMKNIPELHVQYLIDELDLNLFSNKKSRNLSGGNKRKLSVALALIGSPIVAFLDEPSAGMDPAARRFLWEVIKRSSKLSAIVLTTHLMEEAESLSSRIGILKHGSLIAEGTLDSLRKSIGSGVEVRLVHFGIPTEALAIIKAKIRQSFAAELNMISNQNNELKFLVCSDSIDLSEAFKTLEELKKEFGILDYSLNQVSLESIFNSLFANNWQAHSP